MSTLTSVTKKSLLLSKPILFGGAASGLGVVLIVGLLSGLVGRPNNCIPNTTSFPSTSTTSTQGSITSTSTTGSGTGTSTSTTTTITTRTSTTTTTTTTTTTSTTRTSTNTIGPGSTTTSTPSTTTRTSTSTARPSSSTTNPGGSTTTTTTTTTRTSTTTFTTANRTLPSTSTPRPTVTTTQIQNDDVRLPNKTRPTHYDLTLKAFFEPFSSQLPNISQEYFQGLVKINIDVAEVTPSIILHADRALTISKVTLTDQSNNNIGIKSQTRLPFQQYEIGLNSNLAIGKYKLEIEFNGNFGPVSNLVGFYRSRYYEDNQYK